MHGRKPDRWHGHGRRRDGNEQAAVVQQAVSQLREDRKPSPVPDLKGTRFVGSCQRLWSRGPRGNPRIRGYDCEGMAGR